MSARRLFVPFIIAVMLAGLLMPAGKVSAAGSTDIVGNAYQGRTTKYTTARQISQDTRYTVGPSVAFRQSSGPEGLYLRAYACRTDQHY